MLEILPLVVGAVTLGVFVIRGDTWLEGLAEPLLAAVLFVWLFPVMLWGAFGVVRHADALAELLGEPYGTLLLTLAVTGIEVSLIAAIMLTGDAMPTLARDAMLAILMIVLNGLVGGALLIGGLRHREQDYNLRGARAFITVLVPLAVFALVLPAFTVSTAEPTFSPGQAFFFCLVTVLLYAIFLGVQTGRHRGFFTEQPDADGDLDGRSDIGEERRALRSKRFHVVLLLLTLVPIVLLSERMAALVDFGIVTVGVPTALGGVVVALIVLMPEGIAAMRAAHANRLQRSVNILLGAALATIGLTVPAVLAVGLLTGNAVVLGLDRVPMVLLLLTLLLSSLTFGGVRTNLLQGAVHLVVFLAYLMLLFSP
jgi:Ca2+:H+ antiporter